MPGIGRPTADCDDRVFAGGNDGDANPRRNDPAHAVRDHRPDHRRPVRREWQRAGVARALSRGRLRHRLESSAGQGRRQDRHADLRVRATAAGPRNAGCREGAAAAPTDRIEGNASAAHGGNLGGRMEHRRLFRGGGHDRAGAAHGRTGANRYTLSIAAADGPFVSGIDLAAVAPSLDWFNLMTYDFVNAMTPTTGHHTGLHASKLAPADARSTSRAVRQFIAAGVPARKLVIGAAFYGREFAGVQAAHHGLYQRYDHFQGTLPWPQLKADYIDKQGYVRYRDAIAQAPWLWNAGTRSFISYDDPRSIAAKAAFVKAHHLGGIMYWEQSLDPSDELLDAIWHG